MLDQSPISKGKTSEEALQQTLELAKLTDSLGYHRYWVAEHHNTNGLASSSPEILVGRIASVTEQIRVGSGGVLLPQYSPLKVAENFKMLEALFPNRIDLGLGRSPGGGKKTRAALNDGYDKPLSSFSRQIKEVQQFLAAEIPKEHPYYGVSAKPSTKTNPDLWVLGLSERGAQHAAVNGTGFTFGHFINPDQATLSIETYLEKFQPSTNLTNPKINACIFVVCAETNDKAEKLAKSQDMWLLQVEKGLDTRVPSVEEVDYTDFTSKDLSKIKSNRRRCIIGNPAHVYHQLQELCERYQTDEVLLITNIYNFNEKKKSYQLIADYIKSKEK